jgi:NAD(P)H dehydrogenase (quinone)
MRVLLVHADPDPDGFTAQLRVAAQAGLERGGNSVRNISLYDQVSSGRPFEARMSAAEREAYSSGDPILDEVVGRYADDVTWAQALVFVYPTWWFGLPAVLKGWLDRVLVPGVAFTLDPRTEKVKPALTNIRRLVGVTTYEQSRLSVRFFNDSGRRTLLRTLRLVCSRLARSRWLGLYGLGSSTEEQRSRFLQLVERRLERL